MRAMSRAGGFVVLLAVGLALAGCNARPLYGTDAQGGSVAFAMANISIPTQDTRAGQLVRNELLSSFSSTGGAQYALRLMPSEKTSSISSLSGQKLERHRYSLNVKYELVTVSGGKVVNEGASFSNVSYDTLQQPIADLQAAENARARAAREVAEDIRLRVAAMLSQAKP